MNNLLYLFDTKKRRGRPRKVDKKAMREFSIFMIVCMIILFTLLSITVVKVMDNGSMDSLFGNIVGIEKVNISYTIKDNNITLKAIKKDKNIKSITLVKSPYYTYKSSYNEGTYLWNINEKNNKLRVITINIKYTNKTIKQRIFLKR
ncbi:MAG TPA: hypothetical protein PKY25_03500 [Bacilli bacterium]|nr:hypothetical protein [Bacilli bacterium]